MSVPTCSSLSTLPPRAGSVARSVPGCAGIHDAVRRSACLQLLRIGAMALFLGPVLCANADEEWIFRTPPSASMQRVVDADWRNCDAVEVEVERLDDFIQTPLHAVFFFQTKQDQWFQSSCPVLLSVGRAQRIRIRLDEDSPDLQCVDARRPYGPDVLRWVRAWGVKVFSAGPVSGRLRVGALQFQTGDNAKIEIGETRIRRAPAVGAVTPVQARLKGFRGNPFRAADISARLVAKCGGATQYVPMYFVQEFADFRYPGQAESQRVAIERPLWQANWVPEKAGEWRLCVEVQAGRYQASRDLGRIRVGDAIESGEDPAGSSGKNGPENGYVRSRGLLLFEYREGKWGPAAGLESPISFWDVRLDWTGKWGRYTGLGEFDQLAAWNFDQALAAGPAGDTRPILLFDEDELDDSGRFNWVDNPLNRKNGGLLDLPFRQFTDPHAGEIVLDRARYLLARYGRHRRINGLMLLASGEEQEVVGWATQTAEAVMREFPGVRVFCSSPGAPERIGSRKVDFSRRVLSDSRLSPGTTVIHDRTANEMIISGTASDTIAAVMRGVQHWAGEKVFSCDLLPSGAPDREMKVLCFLRTDMATVFQSPLMPLGADRWNRVSFSLDRPEEWACLQNPERRLMAYDLLNIREVGLRFFYPRRSRVDVRTRGWSVAGPYRFEAARQPALAISDLHGAADRVEQYGRLEMDFQLNRVFRNPYDPREIDVSISLTDSRGSERRHPGFFHEGWDLAMAGPVEKPVYTGPASWRIRVSPWMPGPCQWTLTARAGGETAELKGSFTCVAGNAPGFVRLARADPRYFEFSNGDFYYPIGHNLRSPDDSRSENRDPEITQNLAWARQAGTRAYDKWFRRMRESGENFTRIWMCPWWCGLEWNESYEGYHGLSYYNQINAARMDRIMEAAEKEGIYVNLETMNHGALSTKVDEDWVGNPLSQTTQPGGYLRYASEFFDSADALEAHRNRLRYTIARWGYSRAIAWWGVMTETEWVEGYFRSVRGQESSDKVPYAPWIPRPYENHGYRQKVIDWIDETCRFMADTDAHPHPVSGHFSMAYYGEELWRRKNVDVVHNNAYTELVQWWKAAPLSADDGIADVVTFFGKYYTPYSLKKPLMIGEWGGSPYGSSPEHLEAELRTGSWTMAMTRCSGSTGFWWWNVLDAKDLYGVFTPLAAFLKGEDRRGKSLQSSRLTVIFAGAGGEDSSRAAVALYGAGELTAYVYCKAINRRQGSRAPKGWDDPAFPASGEGSMEIPDVIGNGKFVVEYWNTFTGQPTGRKTVVLSPASRRIPLPDHRVDLALKMRAAPMAQAVSP